MSANDPNAPFRIEAGELLEAVERALLDLTGDTGNRALIDEVFRGLHTLKGSGSMFGFEALAGFTHHCETAFDRVRKGLAVASPALIGVVLSARDHMQALIDAGETLDPALEAAGAAILADLAGAVSETADAVAEPACERGWTIAFALPPGALAVSAGAQRNIEDWVLRKRPGTAAAEAARKAKQDRPGGDATE